MHQLSHLQSIVPFGGGVGCGVGVGVGVPHWPPPPLLLHYNLDLQLTVI